MRSAVVKLVNGETKVYNYYISEPRSCVKVEMSLIVLNVVSADVKQH